MSNNNLENAKLPILSRKKHVDVIYIAQLEIMGDVYVRDLSEYHIQMISYFIHWWSLVFKAKVKTSEWELIVIKKVDLVWFLEWSGIEYDTLDEAKMFLEKVDTQEMEEPRMITNPKYKGNKKLDETDYNILKTIWK